MKPEGCDKMRNVVFILVVPLLYLRHPNAFFAHSSSFCLLVPCTDGQCQLLFISLLTTMRHFLFHIIYRCFTNDLLSFEILMYFPPLSRTSFDWSELVAFISFFLFLILMYVPTYFASQPYPLPLRIAAIGIAVIPINLSIYRTCYMQYLDPLGERFQRENQNRKKPRTYSMHRCFVIIGQLPTLKWRKLPQKADVRTSGWWFRRIEQIRRSHLYRNDQKIISWTAWYARDYNRCNIRIWRRKYEKWWFYDRKRPVLPEFNGKTHLSRFIVEHGPFGLNIVLIKVE